ncbi:MAG: ABC transporter permease [Phycisphaerae bacterium]
MNDRIWVLAKRELAAFFYSPIAYVVAAVFLAVSGIFFAGDVFVPGREAQMRDLFDRQAFMLVFILPMLTMRILAEEFRAGTIESLMTAPVRDYEVIVGKFLGTWFFFAAMLVPTLIYAGMVKGYGQADLGPIVTGYFGLLLLGGLYISVGTLTSSLTKNQVVSAVLAFLVLSIFTFLLWGITNRVTGTWQTVLRTLNVYERFGDFSRGLLDPRHVVFFITVTVGTLFVAVKVLESRRWR